MSSASSLASAPASDDQALPFTASFCVHAAPEPGVMPRVLELFAKRGLVPHRYHGAVSGRQLIIDVRVAGLDRGTIDYIARCMRQIVGVDAVVTSTG